MDNPENASNDAYEAIAVFAAGGWRGEVVADDHRVVTTCGHIHRYPVAALVCAASMELTAPSAQRSDQH